MTDRELANDLTVAAVQLQKIVKAIEARTANADRCSCNRWTPGLCAYHSGICQELKQTVDELFQTSGRLLEPGPK
jgi:hypothetical protein